MMKTFKSQQIDDKSNNNQLFGKTVQSYNVENMSNNLGTLNKNQWNNFNQNNNNWRLDEEEEEEKHIDKSGLNQNN